MEDSRPTIICEHCLLNQFVTEKMRCRRCKASFAPVPEAVAVVQERPHEPGKPLTVHQYFGKRFKALRKQKGLSQRQAAKIMDTPRTYFSKIERGREFPNIRQIERLAKTVDVAPIVLIMPEEQFQARELLSDPFVSQFVGLSSLMQRLVLSEAQRLAGRNGR